jgi:acetyl-CoA synthetase
VAWVKTETIEVRGTGFNLENYDAARKSFSWQEVEKNFSWYETGKVNMAYEAIDRHAEGTLADKVALYYSDADRDEQYTFAQMKDYSNQAANVLNKTAVQKGDRVFIFMPRSPELYFSFLGAIKLGAIVGPLFEAFMEGAVKDRLENSEAKVLVTTPELLCRVPLADLPALKDVLLVSPSSPDLNQLQQEHPSVTFHDFHEEMKTASSDLDITWVDKEDGLILHYTSGSTGKPKGVYHVHYAMLQHYQTGKLVLDLKEDDIYWCTADPGWVTGTSYGVFSPWLNGATNVVRGGRFSPQDWYSTIEKYNVSVWYSAPTAFRMLMGAGEDVVKQFDLSSLRHVLSVGEPLNPEVVRWGLQAFDRRIHDSWWMTETGGMLICNYP